MKGDIIKKKIMVNINKNDIVIIVDHIIIDQVVEDMTE